jgi:hypothetical protein
VIWLIIVVIVVGFCVLYFQKIRERNHSRLSALQPRQAERNAIAFIRRWNVKLNLGKSHATSTRVTRFGRLNVVRLTLR